MLEKDVNRGLDNIVWLRGLVGGIPLGALVFGFILGVLCDGSAAEIEMPPMEFESMLPA